MQSDFFIALFQFKLDHQIWWLMFFLLHSRSIHFNLNENFFFSRYFLFPSRNWSIFFNISGKVFCNEVLNSFFFLKSPQKLSSRSFRLHVLSERTTADNWMQLWFIHKLFFDFSQYFSHFSRERENFPEIFGVMKWSMKMRKKLDRFSQKKKQNFKIFMMNIKTDVYDKQLKDMRTFTYRIRSINWRKEDLKWHRSESLSWNFKLKSIKNWCFLSFLGLCRCCGEKSLSFKN